MSAHLSLPLLERWLQNKDPPGILKVPTACPLEGGPPSECVGRDEWMDGGLDGRREKGRWMNEGTVRQPTSEGYEEQKEEE
jgi:hypothetical protein